MARVLRSSAVTSKPCRGGQKLRLPQNDLAYLGFRLAALDMLCQLEISHDSGDDISGYLAEVPVLEQAAPVLQVDLLAGAWRRPAGPRTSRGLAPGRRGR